MTEFEWLSCTDPRPMLKFLQPKRASLRREIPAKLFPHPSDHRRKLRLFGSACCRRISRLMTDERGKIWLELGERYADGWLAREELPRGAPLPPELHDMQRADHQADLAAWLTLFPPVMMASWCVADTAVRAARVEAKTQAADWGIAGLEERRAQASLLRDIFGNPFQATTIQQAWLTRDVVAVAITIYEGRAFERMPELGDALQSAGCTDAGILSHCREPGEHVRGCWVVDAILGKW